MRPNPDLDTTMLVRANIGPQLGLVLLAFIQRLHVKLGLLAEAIIPASRPSSAPGAQARFLVAGRVVALGRARGGGFLGEVGHELSDRGESRADGEKTCFDASVAFVSISGKGLGNLIDGDVHPHARKRNGPCLINVGQDWDENNKTNNGRDEGPGGKAMLVVFFKDVWFQKVLRGSDDKDK